MDETFVVVRHECVLDYIHKITAKATVIGRDRHCGIRLPSPFVSRQHALLVRTDCDLEIRNLNARNGTYLHGRLISQSEPLKAKSEVQIGPYSLTVCVGIAEAIQESARLDGSTMSDRREIQVNDAGAPTIPRLTPAQTRVFDLFAEGLTEKEVAALLQVTVNTVHDHAKAIYKALSVSTRGELVAYWANHPEQRTRNG